MARSGGEQGKPVLLVPMTLRTIIRLRQSMIQIGQIYRHSDCFEQTVVWLNFSRLFLIIQQTNLNYLLAHKHGASRPHPGIRVQNHIDEFDKLTRVAQSLGV